MGFAARKSFVQHLLPSWLAASKSDAKVEFMEKVVSFWLLVFPEDILPGQEEQFYERSRRLEVFHLPVYEPDFLSDCYQRFTAKNLPDTPERCTKRDDITRRTIASRRSLSILEEERARGLVDPNLPRAFLAELLQEVHSSTTSSMKPH